jgi:hypothetical protein
MEIQNEDLDKIVQLFRAGDVQLSIQICEGLEYDYVEILKEIVKHDKVFGKDNSFSFYVNDLQLKYSQSNKYYNIYKTYPCSKMFSKKPDFMVYPLNLEIRTLNQALTKLYNYLKEQ